MTWGFIWLMFVLKIPILMLMGLVWWAIKSSDEPAEDGADNLGAISRPHPPERPRRRRPRGPHGDPAALPVPPRVRPVVTAIGREAVAREHLDHQ